MPQKSSHCPLVQEGSSVLVYLTVRSSAKKNRIVMLDEKSIHVDIKAQAQQGEANRMLIAFFSELVNLPISSFVLKKGHTSHKKVLLIKNSTLPDILKKISPNH